MQLRCAIYRFIALPCAVSLATAVTSELMRVGSVCAVLPCTSVGVCASHTISHPRLSHPPSSAFLVRVPTAGCRLSAILRARTVHITVVP